MAIKLNYMKLDVGVIMEKKSFKELLINGYSFLTKSGRIGGGLLKNLPSKGGLNPIIMVDVK